MFFFFKHSLGLRFSPPENVWPGREADLSSVSTAECMSEFS